MTRRRRGAVLEQRNSAEDMAAALFDSSSPAPARSASSATFAQPQVAHRP